MKIRNLIAGLLIAFFSFLVVPDAAFAHPGRTDANGGHTCRTNCEQWGLSYGEYHYHNGGTAPNTPSTQQVAPAPPVATPKPVVTPKPKASVKPATPKPSPTATPTPSPSATPTPQPKTSELLTKLVSANITKSNVGLAELILQELKAKPGKVTQVLGVETVNGFYKVSEVIDGDTIRVTIDGKSEKVRLLGIDTPETKDPRTTVQCFGLEASKRLTELLAGQNVRLENDTTQPDRDKYQRLLRWVYLEDGTDVNLLMVKEGYAFSYKKYPTQKLDQLNQLEKEARESNVGLWNSCNEYE